MNCPRAWSGFRLVERSPHGVAYAARGPRLRNHPTGSDPRNEYRASSGFDNEESRKKGHRPRCTRRNRSEEHTSELQSLTNIVCRLLLEKKKKRAKKTGQLYVTDTDTRPN